MCTALCGGPPSFHCISLVPRVTMLLSVVSCVICVVLILCNGGAATMVGCLNCFIMGILGFGNCELANGTRFERSGCGFTSCRTNMGSADSDFSRLRDCGER